MNKKSWRQHPTRHQLYGHLPPITKTIQVWPTRHAGHCWRSRDELLSDVLLWSPTHGRAEAGRPARTYIQQLCEDTGCCSEDLPRAMNDREEWRERVKDIRATRSTWWWWWWSQCLLMCCRLGGALWISFLVYVIIKIAQVMLYPKCQPQLKIYISDTALYIYIYRRTWNIFSNWTLYFLSAIHLCQ